MRQLPQQTSALKAGKWQIGVGNSCTARHWESSVTADGSAVAGYGKAFGMNVLVSAREASLKRAQSDGYAVAPNKESFFSGCDVISLHMRLVESTRGIVTAEDLARMKPTALRQYQPRSARRARRIDCRSEKRASRHGRHRCL